MTQRGTASRSQHPAPDDLLDGAIQSAIQSAALAQAFEQAQSILALLADDPAWARLLVYRGYDLHPMALKNLFFALEGPARAFHLARAAGSLAIKADWHQTLREWARPLARFARDRVEVGRAERPAPRGDSPIVAFLDAPHRARLLARTLALLAADHPIHRAGWGERPDFSWPDDLPVRPVASYRWNAYTSHGAAWRIMRHVLGSRARTDLAAFGLDTIGWLPPRLLWTLRFTDIQRYAATLEAFEGLARAQRPALWITLEDLLAFGKCAAAVGERLGIPTLNVQHGIIGAYPYRTGIDVAGTFAAFGEADRQALIARGADPARIVVTGPVRYDDLRTLRVDRGALLRGAGLDPARPVVLFASQPGQRLITEAGRRAALGALAQAAAETGAQVVIKAHPLEDVGALRRLASEKGLSAPVVEGQLYEWLLACDVMATISSTVVYEAAVAERPALLLEWSGNSDVAGYLEAGIGLLPETPAQTGAALCALLTDEGVRAALLARQREFAQHHLAGADGRASERLAALARQLIKDAR
ncbi:MAG: hypothetical protein IT325_11270 [Anaerolineae bacterium]|nr:hypothetical protein [Anaerolineae bacterium]